MFVLMRHYVERAAGCTEQIGCAASGPECSSRSGYTTQLSCITAVDGYVLLLPWFLGGDHVGPCTPVENAVSVTCPAIRNSRAVCEVGFYLVDNVASSVSDECLGAHKLPPVGISSCAVTTSPSRPFFLLVHGGYHRRSEAGFV